jgi:biopolymer transport protein ExbB
MLSPSLSRLLHSINMHSPILSYARAVLAAMIVVASSAYAENSANVLPALPGQSALSTATTPVPTDSPSATPASSASRSPAAPVAVENPYGIEALWKGSDNIARSVLVLLAIMSAGSWYILVTKLLEQSKMNRHARTVDKAFWGHNTVTAGARILEKSSAYRFIAEAGAAATNDHRGLKGHIPMSEWIPMSITAAVDRVHATTQGGLAFLATVGSTSPFVGLFGTVWGIYHALTAIGLSGQASIDKVAGPVGEALIMTAIGLAVAIPAVLAYNWLARRNKAVMDEVREFADELNAVIVGSGGKAA